MGDPAHPTIEARLPDPPVVGCGSAPAPDAERTPGPVPPREIRDGLVVHSL